MLIDFTQHISPLDAIRLADWKREDGPEFSEEDLQDLKELGWDPDKDHSGEYVIENVTATVIVSQRYRMDVRAETLVAELREDGTLRNLRARSRGLAKEQLYPVAKQLIDDWKLTGLDEPESGDEDDDWVKSPAADSLDRWLRDNRRSSMIPGFLAQTDPNPEPGIWFLRVVINEMLEGSGKHVMSAQVFFRDDAFDARQADDGFFARADAHIELANDQAGNERISRVAESLLYSAARFASYSHWTGFDDQPSFDESVDNAIEYYVDEFRLMLLENMEDHSRQFDEDDEEDNSGNESGTNGDD